MLRFALIMGSAENKPTFAEFVRVIRESKGLSLQDVEDASKGAITNGYVSKLENGVVTNPSPKKLKALANGLGITEDEIFAAARGKSLDEASVLTARFASLLQDIEKLKPSDREFVVNGLEMLGQQIANRLATYKTHNLIGIDGKREINIRDLARAIQKAYPDIDTDEILDIYYGRLEGYDQTKIDIVREYEEQFGGNNHDALSTTG